MATNSEAGSYGEGDIVDVDPYAGLEAGLDTLGERFFYPTETEQGYSPTGTEYSRVAFQDDLKKLTLAVGRESWLRRQYTIPFGRALGMNVENAALEAAARKKFKNITYFLAANRGINENYSVQQRKAISLFTEAFDAMLGDEDEEGKSKAPNVRVSLFGYQDRHPGLGGLFNGPKVGHAKLRGPKNKIPLAPGINGLLKDRRAIVPSERENILDALRDIHGVITSDSMRRDVISGDEIAMVFLFIEGKEMQVGADYEIMNLVLNLEKMGVYVAAFYPEGGANLIKLQNSFPEGDVHAYRDANQVGAFIRSEAATRADYLSGLQTTKASGTTTWRG